MGGWLQLRLTQSGANRDAVGAWVEVDLGELGGKRIIRQELTVGGGHASGHSGWMHFGLGTANDVNVRVQWPFGSWSEWQTLAANGFYMIDKERGVKIWKAP